MTVAWELKVPVYAQTFLVGMFVYNLEAQVAQSWG